MTRSRDEGRRLAVLFDLDGTLLWLDVDIESVRRELRAMFAARGYESEFRPILGEIERACASTGADDLQRRALAAAARACISRAEVAAAGAARARDGALEVLRALSGLGACIGIVTDNGRDCVAPALATAGLGAVDVSVSRDDVDAPKPDPAGVAAAARALLPSGGQLWLVGDSPRDVAAGRAARAGLPDIDLRIVAIRGGRGTDAALDAAGADATIDALPELLAVLRAALQ